MAVPKLRFTGFDGDYLELSYDKFAPLQRGFDLPVSTIVEGDYPVVFSNGILKKHNEFKAQAPGVVTGRSGTIGNITWVEKDYWPHNTSLWVTNFFDNEPKYVFYFLQKFDVSRFASGSGVPTLNRNDVHAQLITISPERREQTKIASFLSAVDEKISQLTQKHQLLSQYKQGMMQKLFSQQLRFKADDGSEFGEWEEVKFSGIFNFHQTNSYSRALLAEYGEIMNIHYGDIHTKFSMLFDVNKESVPFLNDEVDTSKIAKEQFLKVGDLVIADASEDYKDIGKSIEVISLNNQKVVAGLHTYIARPVKPFALGFCGYMMQTFPVREQIKKLATGISVLGISKTNLGKVELKVPSLEEQTKIANFLSAIDQKIEVVVQQIEQAKTWKKGLLQQMFV